MRTVIGYASLLSIQSIRRIFPNSYNIRLVRINNHARCFNSVGTLSLSKGLVSSRNKNLAHAAMIFRPDISILTLAFDLNEDDYSHYISYEFRYDLKEVECEIIETGEKIYAIACYENVDHNINIKSIGLDNLLDLYKKYNVSAFWHVEILPADIYLRHCIAAAKMLGENVLENFLATTFLSDRYTNLYSYISQMEDEEFLLKCQLSEIF